MPAEIIYIEIGGDEISDIYPDLSSLEVELDDELAGMFRMRIGLELQSDGEWTHLDDERFQVWQPVVIRAGFDQPDVDLISGYITQVRPMFDPDPSRVYLDVWGMDKSVLLDREEKLKDWPNKKDSDIATEIFGLYGLSTTVDGGPSVEDTEVVHDEALSTIIQRETDMQFLRRLALRNGYECFVQGDVGYFRRPVVDETSQPVLAAHFGTQTTLNKFNIEVNALTPSNVAMYQVDRASKETLEATISETAQTALGARTADSFLTDDVNAANNFVARNGAASSPEMDALCQGLYQRSEWFVNGEGEVDANLYNHVLMPRATVTIKGIGEAYSGVYYVSHVSHVFYSGGYLQKLKVKRNGLFPTGNEDFEAAGGGLLDAIGL